MKKRMGIILSITGLFILLVGTIMMVIYRNWTALWIFIPGLVLGALTLVVAIRGKNKR